MEQETGNHEESATQRQKLVSLDEGLKLAIHLHQSGRFSEAQAIYKSILNIVPEQAEALHFLGILSHQHDTGEDAVALLKKAIQADPEYIDAYNNLGNVYKERGNLDKAVEVYRKVIDMAPEYALAYNNLGAVLHAQGCLPEALSVYEKAAELNVADATIPYNLGNIYKEHGDLQAAVRAYGKALELDDNHADAHYQLGDTLQEQGEKEQAIASYQRAIALKSDQAGYYYSLGNSFREKGLLGEAVSAFRKTLAQDDQFIEAYESAVTCLYLLHKRDESLNLLQQWLRVDPKNPVAMHALTAMLGKDIPERASNAYIEHIFDEFSASFDKVLKGIHYRAPEQSIAALQRMGWKKEARLDVLDAGCGTGLCGPLYRPYARRLVGVDLSAGMLEKARGKAVYDSLVKSELTTYLQQSSEQFDLIVATDTLIYFGALNALLNGMANVLRDKGIIVVSIEDAGEKAPECGFRLNIHGRYSHSLSYLRNCLDEAGLSMCFSEAVILREESAQPVAGLVVLAGK